MSTELMQDWKEYESYSAVMSIGSIIFGEQGWGSVYELSWQDRAACQYVDPGIFYPELGENSLDAKKVCKNCEVSEECLTYALEHNERYGVWGGLNEQDRRKLRRKK